MKIIRLKKEGEEKEREREEGRMEKRKKGGGKEGEGREIIATTREKVDTEINR